MGNMTRNINEIELEKRELSFENETKGKRYGKLQRKRFSFHR
jgi:hypothetical protein